MNRSPDLRLAPERLARRGRAVRRAAARTGAAVFLASLLVPVQVGLAAPSRAGHGADRHLLRSVDDADTGSGRGVFQYTGQWRTRSGGRTHRGTEHHTSEPGSGYALAFQGSGIALYGTKDQHHGIAAVRVDDGPEVLVDLYSPSRREQQLLYTHALLPVGVHRVEVRVTGERNPAASDAVVTVDRAEITEAFAVVDDTTESGPASFAYSGDWSVSTDPDKHQGSDHHSRTPGSSYRFRFSGSRVQLFGARAPGHGRASVSVDGAEPVEVDLYSAERRDDQLVYASPQLLPGKHVVEVTVTGEKRSEALDHAVAVDRAVVYVGNGPGPAAHPLSGSTAASEAFDEDEDHEDDRDEDDRDEDDRDDEGSRRPGDGIEPEWVVEPGSAEVEEIDGKLVKVDSARFHRLISRHRYGGPGRTVRIEYRARATAIRSRRGSSTVAGAKVGMKWPAPSSKSGVDEDGPRSVYGRPKSPTGPGSYIFVTGLTEGGYMELSRNSYGAGGYTFFDSEDVGYKPGTWKDIVITVEWLDEPTIRVRYWHNATGSGEPVYEATDRDSPFWHAPGFLWLRTDDSDWEYDFIRVRERES